MAGADRPPPTNPLAAAPRAPGGRGAMALAAAPLAAIGSMVGFQTGAAVSVPLLVAIGPTTTTWLRLLGAAAVLWAIARPAVAAAPRRDLAAACLLGAATCGMSVLYAEAIARIPLGMATSIEFLGPLGVTVVASRGIRDVGCAALAAIGVALLTLTRSGWSSDPVGIAFAVAAAACWAAYIVLTKRVGRVFPGLQGLTVSLSAAALIALPFGLVQLRRGAQAWQLGAAAALGCVIPVLPYGLEMLALRRMTARAFGILMSADPAVSSLIGWVALHQALGGQKIVGIACVVAASVGASVGTSAIGRTGGP